VGGASANPVRVKAGESALAGQAPTDAALAAAAGHVAAAIASPMSDLYASGEYRVHLASVLARRALAQAVARARS
jgi:CO/xanthine dehydrogenase FAD-binding subunit